MFLERLSIKDFRCFDKNSVDFTDGVHAIVGDNGKGKTSLLEALFFCITGTSFRTPHVKELIRFGKDALFVEARFSRLGVTHTLAISYDGLKRRVSFNGALCTSGAELLGLIWGVACTPEDIELIQGPPATRRHFLDLFLAQTHPFYV
jgi:DNA replication and repair protein RecF